MPAVVHADGRRVEVRNEANLGGGAPTAATTGEDEGSDRSGRSDVATRRLALGTLVGARSGDKGGNANVGLWTRTPAGWEWLDSFLTTERFRTLLPEADGLDVRRYRFPNLSALNFVVVGLLGEGVAASTRPDPQAKGLGEYLRSRLVDIPIELLADHGTE